MTKYIKAFIGNVYGKGHFRIQKKIRDRAVRVMCPKCGMKKTTRANDRTKCFRCKRSFKLERNITGYADKE